MAECMMEWAKEYRKRGFAICRLRPGQKRPTDRRWTCKSREPEDFRPGYGIGIQPGRLSGDLVCVDIDHHDAISLSGRFLPSTNMVEGRPGKEKSHLWYRVVNVPPELTAPEHVAGGIGGPRIRHFDVEGLGRIVDFLGTGSHAVVPASLWTSKDGTRTERRFWHSFGEPAEVDCAELYDCVCRLAGEFSWRPTVEVVSRKTPTSKKNVEVPLLPLPTGRVAQDARAYLAKVEPAIAGQGGDRQTFRAACILVVDFGLTPDESLPLLIEWNARCCPPWRVDELEHKLEMAASLDKPRGSKVRVRSHTITVNLLAGDNNVFVGVDCAAEGRSYIDLKPSLWAGVLKVGHRRELSSELAEVCWEGKAVLLCPPSTVSTNKQEVWGEFFLATALRRAGAEVQSIRLPTLDGRRRTLGQAEGVDWEVIDPPREAWSAVAAAKEASRRAREVSPQRLALPRKKKSPKLQKAIGFIKRNKVKAMTKDVIKKAGRTGISKNTLWRALCTSKALPSSPFCFV